MTSAIRNGYFFIILRIQGWRSQICHDVPAFQFLFRIFVNIFRDARPMYCDVFISSPLLRNATCAMRYCGHNSTALFIFDIIGVLCLLCLSNAGRVHEFVRIGAPQRVARRNDALHVRLTLISTPGNAFQYTRYLVLFTLLVKQGMFFVLQTARA